MTENVEESLTKTVLHRPRRAITEVDDPATTQIATDDAKLGGFDFGELGGLALGAMQLALSRPKSVAMVIVRMLARIAVHGEPLLGGGKMPGGGEIIGGTKVYGGSGSRPKGRSGERGAEYSVAGTACRADGPNPIVQSRPRPILSCTRRVHVDSVQ